MSQREAVLKALQAIDTAPDDFPAVVRSPCFGVLVSVYLREASGVVNELFPELSRESFERGSFFLNVVVPQALSRGARTFARLSRRVRVRIRPLIGGKQRGE